MSERNTITLFSYENGLIGAATWIARIAHLRGLSSDNAPLAFRWFASYGLKIEIKSGNPELAATLRSSSLDVFKVPGSADAFWGRQRLETRLYQQIDRMLCDGLPKIEALNAVTVCSLPACENALTQTATICEPLGKRRWACKKCAAQIANVEVSKRQQRALVTPKLRYEVLARDRFACRACGSPARPEDNITLHVDHIIPVVEGGKTVLENLQTLCSECNLGKGAMMLRDQAGHKNIATTSLYLHANSERATALLLDA